MLNEIYVFLSYNNIGLIVFLSLLFWLVGVFSVLFNIYYTIKMISYIKSDENLWRDRDFLMEPYTTLKKMSFSELRNFNGLQSLKRKVNYIFNDEDINDSKILYYKKRLRFGWTTFVIVIGLFFILTSLLFLIRIFRIN